MLIARKADGTWSPPSGILLHTASLGFVLGVDIYDCVLVINSVAALEMFTRPKVVLGTDVGLTVGPLISPGLLENDVKWKELNNTVLTYLKARGEHQHVRLDGSLVAQRGNENERFYDGEVDVLDILAGNINKSIPETRPLFEVIKAAEGRTDFDAPLLKFLAQQPAPGDAVIETPITSPLSTPRTPFGIPSIEDPDPFGVIALEMAGLEIREAGTRLRPHSTQFEFAPTPTSPVYSKFSRQSTDTYVSKSNRGSFMSSKTQGTAVTDACTQTDGANSPDAIPSVNTSDDSREHAPEKLPTVTEPKEVEVDYTQIDSSPIHHFGPQSTASHQDSATSLPSDHEDTTVVASEAGSAVGADDESDGSPKDERDEDADDEDEDDEDIPIVCEVATAAAPTRTAIASTQVTQVIQAKGALVTIPKRVPPPLPIRSPARMSRASKSEYGDVSSLKSPVRNSIQSVQSVDMASARSPTPVIDETVTQPSDPEAASPSVVAVANSEQESESASQEKEISTHSEGKDRPSIDEAQSVPAIDVADVPETTSPAEEPEPEFQTPRQSQELEETRTIHDEGAKDRDVVNVTSLSPDVNAVAAVQA